MDSYSCEVMPTLRDFRDFDTATAAAVAATKMETADSDGERDHPRQSPGRMPLYTARQPPLVQPLETSAFGERTLTTYGVCDLGREWVTLFQTIGAVSGGYSKSMKLNIPDTVLLSPSGCGAPCRVRLVAVLAMPTLLLLSVLVAGCLACGTQPAHPRTSSLRI